MSSTTAVIFDLYGTLVHVGHKTHPYSKLFSEMGLHTVQERNRAREIALTSSFASLTDFVHEVSRGTTLDVRTYEEEIAQECAATLLYPEAEEVLEQVVRGGFQVGVISNLASPYKTPFYTRNLAQYVDHVLFSCDEGMCKPDPRIYLHMLEMLSVSSGQVLMVGDTLHADVLGPQSVGMRAVLLERECKTTQSIATLTEIYSLL